MASSPEQIGKQLSAVIDDLRNCTSMNGFVEAYDSRRVSTRARAAIQRYAPPGSPYEGEAIKVAEGEGGDQWQAEQLTAIVHALRDDYAAGGLLAIEEIVHADLFDDFLDMAVELLSKRFVGPSAVLAGTVLEEHLRKLAARHEIEIVDDRGRPKSADTLGVELRKAGVVTEVQRKSVVAWYAQRTEGAHGRPQNLNDSEVERMIDGVRDFVSRHPA